MTVRLDQLQIIPTISGTIVAVMKTAKMRSPSSATKANHSLGSQLKIQNVSSIGFTDYHSRSATLPHEWVSPKPRTFVR